LAWINHLQGNFEKAADTSKTIQGKKYDIIIVGGGVLGMAAAYYGSKTSKKILLLEQDQFFNGKGGSTSAGRHFRVQYDDPKISQLVLDSLPLWKNLQSSSQEELFIPTGFLWFGNLNAATIEGSIQGSVETFRKLHLPFEMLSAQEIENRYHFSNIPSEWKGFMDRNGGMLNVKGTLRAFYKGAQGKVEFLEKTKIIGLESTADGVVVKTKEGILQCDKLILTPGTGINELLKSFDIQLNYNIWKMDLAYFKLNNPNIDYPVWIGFQAGSEKDPNRYYGLAKNNWLYPGYIQVGANYPSQIYQSFSEVVHEPDPETIANISNWVRNHMRNLDPEPKFSATCIVALFTDPKDNMKIRHELLLDFAPASVPFHNNIILCATGMAFKLAPLIGKILIDLALEGHTNHDITSFKFQPDMIER
jgi:glycine/D-amino acid oxidase-like deaminating enzyme